MARDPQIQNDEVEAAARPSRSERFGQWSEAIARAMGTPTFLVVLSMFCILWITWNTLAPEAWRFDSAAIGFTALTLILSLQASYAAPMILLAQNRQDDRDRVHIAQDRKRAERNLADTEFLAREVVALRLAVQELPDRDWVRQELRALLAELAENDDAPAGESKAPYTRPAAAPKPADGAIAQKESAEAEEQQAPPVAIKLEQNPLTGRIDIITPDDK